MLRQLASPYAVGVASRVAGQLISFLAVAIASRFLDLEAFGTYALAWAVTVIANTFVFTGLYQALLRSRAFEEDRDTLFWLLAGVGGLGTAAILCIGMLAGGAADQMGWTLLALAPIPLLIVPTAWWEAQLVRSRRVRAASLYVVVAEASGLLTAWTMLRAGWGVEALIASRYASTAVGLMLTGGLIRALPRLTLRRATARDAGATALPLWGTTSVGLFSNYGADLILGAFLNATAVGAYRGGARIAMTASDLVLQPLMMLSWSRFTRIEKEGAGTGGLKDAWLENMAIAAAILWPMVATVTLLAPELVVTILDETWLPAAGIVAILSVSRGLSFLTALLEPTMMTTGRAGVQLKIRLFGAVSLLILLLAFGRLGAEAAAWAHLGSSALVGTVALVAMSRALRLRPADLIAAFLPGVALTSLTVAAILGTETQRASLGPDVGLLLTVLAVAAAWALPMLIFLRRRVLVLPAP